MVTDTQRPGPDARLGCAPTGHLPAAPILGVRFFRLRLLPAYVTGKQSKGEGFRATTEDSVGE